MILEIDIFLMGDLLWVVYLFVDVVCFEIFRYFWLIDFVVDNKVVGGFDLVIEVDCVVECVMC